MFCPNTPLAIGNESEGFVDQELVAIYGPGWKTGLNQGPAVVHWRQVWLIMNKLGLSDSVERLVSINEPAVVG